jgi:hypothetical protein
MGGARGKVKMDAPEWLPEWLLLWVMDLENGGVLGYEAGMMILMLRDRAVLRVRGADAFEFLQGLLSQDVALLAPERPLYAGLLSAQGKTLFAVLLFAGEDGEILIDVAAAQADALARRLAMYKLRKAVEIAAAPELAVFAAKQAVEGRAMDPRTALLGARWIAAGPGDSAADDAGWRAHRLALGVAEAAELGSDALLWLETGADLLNGVSFTKGCYVGQENTARMHHRDRVRRRIVPLRLAGAGAGPVGEGVLRDEAGRSVGNVLGTEEGDVVLAHLRLEAVGAPILLGGAAVTVLRPDWLAPAIDAALEGAA